MDQDARRRVYRPDNYGVRGKGDDYRPGIGSANRDGGRALDVYQDFGAALGVAGRRLRLVANGSRESVPLAVA